MVEGKAMNHETMQVALRLEHTRHWRAIALSKVKEARGNLGLGEQLTEEQRLELVGELERILKRWIGGAIDKAKDLLREQAVSLDEIIIDLLEAAAAKINYRELAEDLLCE